jgi:uncharacterized hydrophobic protein (TIGR00271 family)
MLALRFEYFLQVYIEISFHKRQGFIKEVDVNERANAETITELDDEIQGVVRVGRLITSVGRASATGLALTPGLFLLLAGSAVGTVGINAITSTILVTIVLGLTLLNVFELLGGSSARGGTSAFVYESMGALGGFLTGWALLAGNLALSVVLIKVASGHILQLFPNLLLDLTQIGLGITFILYLVQIFRTLPKQGWTLPAVVLFFISIAVLLISGISAFDSAVVQKAPPFGMGDILRVAAMMTITYAGLEAVMASRRQIQDPTRRLPTSLIRVLYPSAIFLAVGFLVVSGLPAMYGGGEDVGVLEIASMGGGIPVWIVQGLSVAILLFAANAALMTAARQLHAFVRWGAMPRVILNVRSPFRLPPLLFVLLGAVATPLLMFVSVGRMIDLAAALIIGPILMVNVAAIVSRRMEPDRRRPFLVPFFPLVPLVATAIGVTLLFALPSSELLWGAGWLVLGLIIYQVYSRSRLIEAQEGVRVFGVSPERAKPEGKYRILVPVGKGAERRLALELATSLARQLEGELIALQVVAIPDPLAVEEGQRLAQERNTLFQWSTRFAAKSGIDLYPITRLARSVHEGILQTAVEEKCDLIFLSWSLDKDPRGDRLGRVLDPVIRRAPCDVVVLAFRPEAVSLAESVGEIKGEKQAKSFPINRILVTIAGGPHAPLASNLAVLLAKEHDAATSGLYVAGPDATPDAIADGEAWIQKTLDRMREQAAKLPGEAFQDATEEELTFETQVVRADSVLEGIVEAGTESDLVLVGASEESLLDQVLFGTLAEDVARICPTPVLMVKRYRGLRQFWFQRIWDAIYGILPTVSVADRLEVYRRVRRSSRPDVDYFIMIGLSAIIASYGLLQDSSAVIIGGMLVAPLFTPILAISLAIVRGDIQLLRLAIESALKGILLAIGVAILITVISPLKGVGGEIAARVTPNLFDLAVALASGAAGAYAIARKDVAASLPGVAIAAALVPPLSVLGIGLAIGDAQVAGGGGLLFLTNLVAIVLAGAVTLLLLGFRPAERGEREARLRRGLVVSLALLVVITVPLAILFARAVESSSIRQSINHVMTQEVAANDELELLEFDFQEEGDGLIVSARLYAYTPPSEDLVELWSERLTETLRRPVRLSLISIPVSSIESSGD